MEISDKSAKIFPVLAVASASFFGLYLLSSFILAKTTGLSISEVPVIDHGKLYPLWVLPAVAGMALSGTAISLLLPGIPWCLVFQRSRLCLTRLFYQSFVINLLQYGIVMTVWKAIFGTSPSRAEFVIWQAAVTFVGFIILYKRKTRNGLDMADSRQAHVFLIGAIVILVMLPFMMQQKVFIEDLTGDGTECFEFARSLKEHYLPYWDLENGHYGFYPSFHLFSFPIYYVMQTLGECEAAARIPVFFYLFGVYLVLIELVRMGSKESSAMQQALLLGAVAFFLMYFAYHSTYELFADLAIPAGTDIFFTLLAFSALFSLANNERIWWGVLAFLGSTALAAGLPFALLILAARYISDRPILKEISRDTMTFAIPWTVYQALVVIYTAYCPMGPTDTIKYSFTWVFAQYGFGFNSEATLSLLKKFLMVSGFLPAFGLVFLLMKDRIARLSGLTAIGYFFVLAAFGRAHVHYLTPICLLPLIVSLRGLQNLPGRFRTFLTFGLAASLIMVSIWTFPRGYKPHTTYREFGSHTLMLFDTYPDAVNAAQPFTELFGAGIINQYRLSFSGSVNVEIPLTELFGARKWTPDSKIPWGMGHHTWIFYSDREAVPGKKYLQILTSIKKNIEVPAGFRRLQGSEGWVLLYDERRSAFNSILSMRNLPK